MIVRFGDAKYSECCDTDVKKQEFLRVCNQQVAPAICVDIAEGSLLVKVSVGRDRDLYNEVYNKVVDCDFDFSAFDSTLSSAGCHAVPYCNLFFSILFSVDFGFYLLGDTRRIQ